LKGVGVILEGAVGSIHPDRAAEALNNLQEALIVLWNGFAGIGQHRQMINAQEDIVGRSNVTAGFVL